MKTCVLNITAHDSSLCLLDGDDIEYFIQEERLSRIKYDSFPAKSVIELSNRNGGATIDNLIITGTIQYGYTEIVQLFQKYFRVLKVYDYTGSHHLCHAATAFYNSGFHEAVSIVVDGAGSYDQATDSWEESSIFHCKHPSEFNLLFQKKMSRQDRPQQVSDDGTIAIDGKPGIVKMYEGVTVYLGYGPIEAGKTMGLSAYGKENSDIPEMVRHGVPNMGLFLQDYPSTSVLDEKYLGMERTLELEQDLAYQVQKISEETMFSLIEKACQLSRCNNVTISGGFGLNCVANYKYLKRFPDLNFFIEPNAGDAGTAMGIGKYTYYATHENATHTIKPLETLYLGGQYDPRDNGYVSTHAKGVTGKEVAQLLVDGKIVGIFQGRSEAGPRALGNRSILMDPRIANGKDIINRVKAREWFRPFAGTVLEEEAAYWFEMDRLSSSPFMTYAIPVKPEKAHEIPSILHVDGTCRIQTVNPDQNANYYSLISEFYRLTGVPILLNTSLNVKMENTVGPNAGMVSGQPIVETVDDAIDALKKSGIDYIYFADYGIIVE